MSSQFNQKHDNVNYMAITANKGAKTKKSKTILCSAIFATTKSGVFIYYLGSSASENWILVRPLKASQLNVLG